MAFESRDFAGAAAETTITAGINASEMSITIASVTGWPTGGANGDFFIVIDRGLAAEEKIRIASRSGATLTVAASGRGADNSTAASHPTGAAIEHVFTAVDADEANRAVAAVLGGVGQIVAGFGSAAAPIYAFAGDTDTGVYRSAADILGITTGGVQRLLVSSAGVVTSVGVDVGGAVSAGLHGELRFIVDLGNGTQHSLTSMASGNSNMNFDFRAASNIGSWRWRNGTNAGSTVMLLSATGGLFATTTSGFGNGALGAAGCYLELYGDTTDTIFTSRGTPTNINMYLRSKGTGSIVLQSNLGGSGIGVQVGSSGASATLAFYGVTPIVKQTGVAVTAAAIHAALVNVGLIAA